MISATNEKPKTTLAPEPGSRRARALLLIIVLFAAAMRLWRSPWSASDLAVIPDSIEYAVGAQRLATLGRYDIEIEGVAYPPRCPPWFSTLIAPAYLVAPNELGAGIVIVFALTLCAVGAAFVIGGRLAGEWGAVAAALALACYGEFRRDAMKIMTDVPALAFALWACVLYLRLRHGEGRTASWLLAGALCGAAFALRLELLALCAPFALLLLQGWSVRRRACSAPTSHVASERELTGIAALEFSWLRAALFVSPVITVILANTVYNQATFGSWRRTGYHFWLPELHDTMSQVLSPRFIAANLAKLKSVWACTAIGFGVVGGWKLLSSRGRAVDASAAAIPGSNAAVIPRLSTDLHYPAGCEARALATFFVLAALPGTLFHLFYFYPDLRFHLFALTLLCIAAGAGIVTFIDERTRRRLRWSLPLIALATIALPASPAPVPYRRIVAETLARETPPNAVIVTALEPVYLEPLLLRGTQRRIVPYSRAVEYAGRKPAIEWLASSRFARAEGVAPPRSPVCDFTADEDPHRIATLVRSSVPVVLDASFLPKDFPMERLVDTELELAPSGKPWVSHFALRR